MITFKQKKANQQNAKKSTGPKTYVGKQKSKLNALKHGLTAKDIVIPGENPKDYEELIEEYVSHYNPDGPTERFFVEQMANASFKLHRALRLESAVMRAHNLKVIQNLALSKARKYKDPTYKSNIDNMLGSRFKRIEAWPEAEKNLHKAALKQHEIAKDGEESPDILIGTAYLLDSINGNSISKLVRYTLENERAYYRALRELERLQNDRKTVNVSVIGDSKLLKSTGEFDTNSEN